MPKMKVSVYFSEPEVRELKKLAENHNAGLSGIIREGILDYYKIRRWEF